MTQSKHDTEQTTQDAERTRLILETALQLLRSSQPKQALDLLQQALTETPGHISALLLKGKIHRETGETAHAIRDFQHILTLAPDHHEANLELAKLYHSANDNRVALHHIEAAEKAQPEHQQTLEHKSMILGGLHRYNEAAAILENIIENGTPHHFNWNNLANIYKGLGLFEEAERHYLTAIELSGDNDIAYNNYLSFCHYIPHYPKEKILKLYKDWEARYAKNTAQIGHSVTALNADKTLRIGMISDGFRTHPVGQMITSALEEIPPHEIEIYAYSTNLSEDAVTQRIKNLSTKWMTVVHLDEQELARQLVEDKIDILFDLCGHNSGSYMRTMAMKPAPILVKWVGGLINTTGLSTMDYLLSDKIETPEGEDEFYTEKLIRMPDDYICYNSPIYTPDIQAPPARYNGYITLGCFNNPTKLNPVLLKQWARIMHSLPDSRLFLKGFQFSSETLTNNTKALLLEQGIGEERVIIEGPSYHEDLLKAYNKIDIALDPWPYSGGLTTCEAMYMGVPVVTLPGPTFAGRHSATHLTNAGMPQLVAEDWDQYHDIVLALASDLDNLANIRTHLRSALLESPVCDAQRFARNFSNAMRAIWQRHCEGKEPAALSLDKEGNACFSDEAEPVQLQLPPEPIEIEDDDFHFRFSGKIVTLDNGAGLCSSPAFAGLHKLGALSTICLDPAGRLTNAQQLQHTGDFHYVPMTVLGDGALKTLFITADINQTGTLHPHPSRAEQVLTTVPAQSIKLDEISTPEPLDWLVFDDNNSLMEAMEHGQSTLQNALFVQVKLSFNNQSLLLLGQAEQCLANLGYEFYGFTNQTSISCAELPLNTTKTIASKIRNIDAIFLKNSEELGKLDENRKMKLAFLSHSVFNFCDLCYLTLDSISKDLADNYLVDNKIKEKKQQNAIDLPTAPAMTPKERELFQKYISRCKRYFEFGSGGSSVVAKEHGLTVYGVESDKNWVDKLKEHLGDDFKVEHVDIGPTGEWGYPTSKDEEKFPHYSRSIFNHKDHFDLILVDGRFRVACTISSIMHTLKASPSPYATKIFIHDFWNRSQYHKTLEFLDEIERVESAGVFKIKKNIKEECLHLVWKEYSTNPQ
ncbi:peptide-binding protein [Zobellella endophytica]|uniref:protein O-GlcNAc transferase n=1 Tax=Zobellella endophytica TaxID=2116700 RepID=A0A2P7R7T9_9GAMM|nr:tetratricopeptide repeat protein [Zobellella endophytica]PSJ46277.1 peptide-binding protein [Zobellella endophytica]